MKYLTGTCLDMCPVSERLKREKEKLLHSFELSQNNSKQRYKADPDKTIKEFRRSAAGQRECKADEVRPPHVLKSTMEYMINNLLLKRGVPWVEIYNFMFDRIRAIRLDLVLQQIWNNESCTILELAVRFYVYAAYRLCDEPIEIYDSHINSIHLQECLKHVLVLYQTLSSPAQHEITSLYLLHNLNSSTALEHVLTLPKSIRQHDLLNLILKICLLRLTNNYVQIFRIVKNLPPLQMCACFLHIHNLQRESLSIMNVAFSSRNAFYPAVHLSNLLFFGDVEKMEKMCGDNNIEVADSKVFFRKPASLASSIHNSGISKKLHLIDEKLNKIDVKDLILSFS